MEPKPLQNGELPIWVGGHSDAALSRVGEKGDGWLANAIVNEDVAKESLAGIRGHAEAVGRDPASIGLQMMLDVPPTNDRGRQFYKDMNRVRERAEEVESWGFEYGSINATAIIQSGA